MLDSRQLEAFAEDGFLDLGCAVDNRVCAELMAEVHSRRRFSSAMFLSEQAYDLAPQHRDVNPKPGRNLTEAFPELMARVERTLEIRDALVAILGPNPTLLDRKIVCGLPESWVPDWLRRRIGGNPVNNLGPYVDSAFRDVTYFYGIDFHQDIVDLPDHKPDFITLYVYLSDVGSEDAPLNLLKGTHVAGRDLFPHQVRQSQGEGDTWFYRRHGIDDEVRYERRILTARTGNVALWHSYTLHGTQPCSGDTPRVSLRYLFSADADAKDTFVHSLNRKISGDTLASAKRSDLDDQGMPRMKSNALFEEHWKKHGR